MATLPSVLTAEEYIKSFPNKELTPLSSSNPSKSEIIRLKSETLENLASIYCTLPSGRNSWMAIIQTNAEFLAFHGQAFIQPNEPGYPNHDAWVPQHRVNQDLRLYNIALTQWMEYNAISDAIRNQLIDAINDSLITTLKEPIVGYSRRTPYEIVAYIESKYNKLTTTDISRNDATLREPYDPSIDIELYFKKIEDCVHLVADTSPYHPIQVINAAYESMYSTGLYHESCETWDTKPDIDKTWANFKVYFQAEQTRINRRTAQSAGYANSNVVDSSVFNEATEAFTNLANATVVDRESMLKQNNIIEALAAQVKAANAQVAALTVQLASLAAAAGSHGGDNNNNNNNNNRNGRGTHNNNRNGGPAGNGTDAREVFPNENKLANGDDVKAGPRKIWGSKGKDHGGYCWSHGYRVHPITHTSALCNNKADGHKDESNRTNTMGGSTYGKDKY